MDKRSEGQFPKVNKVIMGDTAEAPASIQDTHLKFRGKETSPGSGVKVGSPDNQFKLSDTSPETMRRISSNITEATKSGETAKYNARFRERQNKAKHAKEGTKPNVIKISSDPAKGK